MNRYPIYIISKGRYENCLTARFFMKDGVDFKLVVEPQQAAEYSSRFGHDNVLVLPFSDLGQGSIPARNWVWEHSMIGNHKRHWIFDDNIRDIRRLFKGKRIPCNAKYAIQVIEEFTDRYENIGISGMNYMKFVLDDTPAPFYLNVHVYSGLLILNELSYRWRGKYNEDTDLCLQVLSGGWCTVLNNVFMIDKMTTMKMKGGNFDELYKDDGRLQMARSLERSWPGVVTTTRKFQRPQHSVKGTWRGFDTQLIRRKDIDWKSLEGKTNEFGMKLKKQKAIQSEAMQKYYKENNG